MREPHERRYFAEAVQPLLGGDVEYLPALLGKVSDLDRRACRATAEARFSIQRMASEHAALYEQVAAPDLRTVG